MERPSKYDIIMKAINTICKILPSYGQISSIYVKTGEFVTGYNIALNFNGNTISSVVKGEERRSKYTVTSSSITVLALYLSSVLTGAVELKDTLTIKPNRGIHLPFEVRLCDTPATTQSAITVTIPD